MKVYFTATQRTQKSLTRIYASINNFLLKSGYEVFEKVIRNHVPERSDIASHEIQTWFDEWNTYVTESDVVVVEGSYPSTIHIGFEIGFILARGKPVILLYERGFDPVFIHSLYSSRLIKSEYTADSLDDVLTWCFDELKHVMQRRFTFFVSPQIDEFLDAVSKKQNIPRSEYIRMLIERQMPHKPS